MLKWGTTTTGCCTKKLMLNAAWFIGSPVKKTAQHELSLSMNIITCHNSLLEELAPCMPCLTFHSS